MIPIRIYHADCSGEFRKLLAQAIHQSDDMQLVGAGPDGREAELAVRDTEPDVLIMSLTLQFLDGMELIQRMQRLAHKPRILVLSYLVRDFCIEEAMRLGADYFMLKPCTLTLVLERARSLVQAVNGEHSRVAKSALATSQPILLILLNRLGVSPELSGYRYIVDGVRIMLNHGGGSLTKELYPQIASAHHVSGPAVERAIRHAIDSAWQHPTNAARIALFPSRERPSNSRFLLRLASACEAPSLEEALKA